MKKSKFFNLGSVGIIFLLLVSCLEEINDIDTLADPTVTPLIEFPLATDNFTMRQFLEEGESEAFVSEENGVVMITFDDFFFTQSAEDFFQFPDQNATPIRLTGVDFGFIPPGSSVTLTAGQTFVMDNPLPDRLDSILVKSGSLEIDVSSTFPADITASLTFHSIQNNGLPLIVDFVLGPNGRFTSSELLGGHTLTLTQGGSNNNSFSYEMEVTLTAGGAPISGTDELVFDFDILNLAFSAIFGELAPRSILSDLDTVVIDLFDNVQSGVLQLEDPRINLLFENSFGIPMEVDIQNLRAVTIDNSILPLTGQVVTADNPHLIGAPTLAQLGSTVSSSININRQNSNIPDFISSFPKYIIYQFQALTIAPAAGEKLFVLDTSQVDIGVEVELPLHGNLRGLRLGRRFQFKPTALDDFINADIMVFTRNRFPVEIGLQGYFFNDRDQLTDSLFNNGRRLVDAAQVDAEGFSVEPSELERVLEATSDKIDRISESSSVFIDVILFTGNRGVMPVKISPQDFIDINIGVRGRLELGL